MKKTNSTRPRFNHLIITQHARERLGERGLWPALGHIARIAHHSASPHYPDRSADGRAVERIEADGFVIIVARGAKNNKITLLTVHSGQEKGARACQRIASYSRCLPNGVRS